MTGKDFAELKCLDKGSSRVPCSGKVEYRFALSGTGRQHPRCDAHWDLRLRKQAEVERKYAPFSDCQPAGFDPADAGESWDDA